MQDHTIKRIKRNTSLSLSQKILLVSIGIFFAIFLSFSVMLYTKVKTEKEYNAAKVYGETVASGIELCLNQSLNSTEMLKDLYIEFGKLFVDDFERICKRLIEDNVIIGSLYLAPDAVIRCAYPSTVADSTIGFEMLKDPDQGPKALLAIETKKITVAGPHKLVEGGTGFIIRNPIFVNDQFKAFSIVVLDWDEFVKQVLSKISQEDSGYKFGVWKDNDSHVVQDENGFIFTNCNSNVSRIIDLKIDVPNDIWHLSIEPLNGWTVGNHLNQEILICFIIWLSIVTFTYLRQREHSKKLFSANHDELTGLLQRTAFIRRVDELLKEHPNKKFTIVASDIKDFKLYNSLYGVEKCDETIVYLGNTFEAINKIGITCRYGGDQFMSIFPTQNAAESFDVVKQNNISVAKLAPIPNLNIKYGIFEGFDSSVSASQACDRALLAARSIHDSFEEIVTNYAGAVSKENMRRQVLESSFLSAINNEDFKVWFQPKFDAVTEKMVGAEALVRWIKQDGTIVSPAEFINVFENDGLISRLDLYVFRHVCEQMKKWKDAGKELFPISINVSRVSLHHPDIIKKYRQIVDDCGLDYSLVPLEITESAASDSAETQRIAQEFKNAGFKIHQDDFGSGFSSLGNLNTMDFDEIKLDKILIDYIGTPDGDELLKHVISLLKFKGLKTIAEGVETREQLDFLKNLKCDHIQGYYFAAPMNYDKFIEFVKDHR